MLERGERAVRVPLRQRLALETRRRVSMLRTEIAVGSPDLARFGIVVGAIGLQTLVLNSPGHFRPAGSAFFAGFVALGTLASLLVAFLSTLSIRSFTNARLRQAIGVLGIVLLGVLTVSGVQKGINGARAFVEGVPYSNDGAVMDLYAAQQVLRHRNPYEKTNIVQALAALDAPATTTTPLIAGQFRGTQAYPSEVAVQQVFMNVLRHRWQPGVPVPPEFESKYNYPAGSFLFILPFVGIGVHDLRFLYALALAAIGFYLWRRMPPALKILVPFLILADVPLMALTGGGQPDTMYGFFLLIALAEWGTPWASPLSMGIAAATKQLAWFFLPLYLVLIVRKLGWREGGRRAAIVGGVFTAMNFPFFLESPASYVTSVAGPMTDPMFPLGIGAIALFVSNVLPMPAKPWFAVAEMLTWAGTVIGAWKWRVLVPASIAVLGVLPLFFAWRSLVNYFYLAPLLALGVSLAARAQDQRVAERT